MPRNHGLQERIANSEVDWSGMGQHGHLSSVMQAEGKSQRRARRFAYISTDGFRGPI